MGDDQTATTSAPEGPAIALTSVLAEGHELLRAVPGRGSSEAAVSA